MGTIYDSRGRDKGAEQIKAQAQQMMLDKNRPPPPPDAADAAIREASAGERRRQLTSGRASFLSGALGDTSAVPTATKRLLGA